MKNLLHTFFKLFALPLLLLPALANAQTPIDTVNLMHWNLYQWTGTPGANNPQRVSYVRKAVKYVNPDIFCVNEVENANGVSILLNQVLNYGEPNRYAAAPFMGTAPGDSYEQLFYDQNKFQLLSYGFYASTPRSFFHYKLLYKDPDLSDPNGTHDSVIVSFVLAHLKASNTTADAATRNTQVATLLNTLQVREQSLKNYFFAGDMNYYSASESGFATTIDSVTRPNHSFRDPLRKSWARITYTQSPRQTQFDGGVNGGLDDRFDFIFTSPDVVKEGDNGVLMQRNTYRAIGNDGTNFDGQNLNSRPNTAYPDSVVQGVYWGSDHLPLSVRLTIQPPMRTATRPSIGVNYSFRMGTINPASFSYSSEASITASVEVNISDLMGRQVYHSTANASQASNFSLPQLNNGMYVITLSNGPVAFSRRVVVNK